MPQQAHVTSVEAIEAFRASLIIYLGKARSALEEVSGDVLRTKLWLQDDQRDNLDNEMRRRTKLLEQAQQALSSARLSNLQQSSTFEQMAVQRARRAVQETEAKLKFVKKWNREFDSRAEPLVKQMEKLHSVLTHDMVKAVAYLAEAIKTLAAYAEIAPGSAAVSERPLTEEENGGNIGTTVKIPASATEGRSLEKGES